MTTRQIGRITFAMKREAATEVIVMRVTPTQKKRMEAIASGLSLNLSAWIRMVAVGALKRSGHV